MIETGVADDVGSVTDDDKQTPDAYTDEDGDPRSLEEFLEHAPVPVLIEYAQICDELRNQSRDDERPVIAMQFRDQAFQTRRTAREKTNTTETLND